MTAASRTGLGGAALLCLFLAMAVASKAPSLRGGAAGAGAVDGSPGLLVEISRRPAFALGFRNTLADIVWLQAVQACGRRDMSRRDYDRLARLLDAVANYDPKFLVPYLLGGVVLGESPDHSREAIRILVRGQEQYPADWRFPFYIGFNEYFSLGDAVQGGRSMAAAARLPGSPRYLGPLAARMLAEAREPATAIGILVEMERIETDEVRRGVLRRRIREIVVERDIQALEKSVAAFRERHGRLPADLGELVTAGLAARIPRGPDGDIYLLRPDGTVVSDRTPRRFKVYRNR